MKELIHALPRIARPKSVELLCDVTFLIRTSPRRRQAFMQTRGGGFKLPRIISELLQRNLNKTGLHRFFYFDFGAPLNLALCRRIISISITPNLLPSVRSAVL